jgi:hypothetical protein
MCSKFLCNFLFAIENYPLIFTRFTDLQNCEKITLEPVIISIAPARRGTILPVVGEVTRIKRNKLNSDMCKRSIVSRYRDLFYVLTDMDGSSVCFRKHSSMIFPRD